MRAWMLSLMFVLTSTGIARAAGRECNIANVMFGKVRIELIPHGQYETGVVFGDDFDSKRFAYGDILGQIAAPERDGSRRLSDVHQNVCGIVAEDGTIDTSEAECATCNKQVKIKLQKVTHDSFVVLSNDTIQGTVKGRLPR